MHKFELAGALAGKTVNLGGYQFTNGVFTLDGEDQTVEGLTSYLERCYYAFPAGSQALADANERFAREQDSGLTEEAQAPITDIEPSPLTEVIDQLDAGNDEHWTSTGLPSVEAVADLMGEKVTRDQIDKAAPGFNRAAAKAAAALK